MFKFITIPHLGLKLSYVSRRPGGLNYKQKFISMSTLPGISDMASDRQDLKIQPAPMLIKISGPHGIPSLR